MLYVLMSAFPENHSLSTSKGKLTHSRTLKCDLQLIFNLSLILSLISSYSEVIRYNAFAP